ncbi:MAG: VCBS repeat-containing protein [Phycisphaerales bacterium]|nr:VCBS repeat-containing protein [Phycisphaerales bacterium]
MASKFLKSLALVTGIAVLWWGCGPVITFEGSRDEGLDRGFVEGGGTFTEHEDAGLLPPLVPEVEDETSTESFFLARSIDPASEDSAGPKFIVVGDIDNDGLPDLASAWNQSQVVQIHLQRRDGNDVVFFSSTQIAGTSPIAITAGVKLVDMDNDDWLDIVVLVKHQGYIPICPLNGEELDDGFTGVAAILFSPGNATTIENGAEWTETLITASLELNPDPPGGIPPGRPVDEGGRALDVPENGGMTAIDVGDVTGDGNPDIVITSNRPDEPCHSDNQNDVELYPNPGGAGARNDAAWTQILVDRGAQPLKALRLVDVDIDGRLDVVMTRPGTVSANISWRRSLGGGAFDARRPIGQIDGGADQITPGDVDGDGLVDIVVRSNNGKVVQWFRHPGPDDDLNVSVTVPPREDIPWTVYTLLDLGDRSPLGISLGDINFDGRPEVLLGADGSVFWLDSSTAPSVYDLWSANLIVDDAQLDNSLFASQGPAFINELLVFDIDCDGATDIIATIDRQSQSGLSNDVVVWFRNVLLPGDVGLDVPLIPGCKQPP